MTASSTERTRRIGRIVEQGRSYHINSVQGYGITCSMMTTNGDARYIAEIAANRRMIVDRHVSQGIDYTLAVFIGDTDISDMDIDAAFKVITDAAGQVGYSDLNYRLRSQHTL